MTRDIRLGYPYRTLVALAAALAIGVLLCVLPLSPGLAWTLSAVALVIGVALIVRRSYRATRALDQNAAVLSALGATTSDFPVSLRTRMPLVMVLGDGLEHLFNHDGAAPRLAHIGDGAIWLRVDRPQDLPHLAVAVRQWRDGRAPDGVVLALAPALHVDDDGLAQALRLVRQAVSDASRLIGTRLPGYLAVYQRLTNDATEPGNVPQWYGVSSATRLRDASRFEPVIRAAEVEVQRAEGGRAPAWRAAGLAALVDWTQRVVTSTLHDPRQPATPWRLYGATWIDCGPASGDATPWARAIQARTHLVPPSLPGSPALWPLPQPLLEAMPRRLWLSPRLAAFAHGLCIFACAAAVACWGAAKNNEALLAQVGADLGRFSMILVDHDVARRDALQALSAQRDRLDRYQRTSVPLRLSFGMYRGAALLPVLNDAIASYQPPPPAPTIVTLDSMSLFDSGRALLKPGSTRAMVGALEMIKTHPDKRILVAGYTDNAGNPASNQLLSVARAGAVRDWLMEVSGIPASRFAIQGYGDTRPIADNRTPTGRARNRRVEITLVPDSPGT